MLVKPPVPPVDNAAVKPPVKVDVVVQPPVKVDVVVQPPVIVDVPLQPPVPAVDNGVVDVVKQDVVLPVAAPVAPWSMRTQVICVLWVMAILMVVLFNILLYLHDMQQPTSEYVHEGDQGPKAPAPPAPKPTKQSVMWTCVYTAILAVSFIPGMIFLT